MQYVKWALGILLLLAVVSFFHYTLPGRDIVRITGTEVTLSQKGLSNPSAGIQDSLDLRFINAVNSNDNSRVYRNEDTGWGWPPYFKFDSADIAAQAQAYAKEDELWVAVTHYGWRNQIFSMFPNVVSMKPVDGPDVQLIPWFNIIFFIVLAIVLFFIIRAFLRFKSNTIDPVIDNIEDMVEDVGEGAEQAQAQALAAKKSILGWFKSLFGDADKKS